MEFKQLKGEHEDTPRAPLSLHIQHKVPFNCLFDFLRLNTDISLGNGCAAVLKELLYKDDVIVAVLVNLCCIEFAEAMSADIAVPKIVTYDFELLLDLMRCQRKDKFI